jgi:hypothetical protein
MEDSSIEAIEFHKDNLNKLISREEFGHLFIPRKGDKIIIRSWGQSEIVGKVKKIDIYYSEGNNYKVVIDIYLR